MSLPGLPKQKRKPLGQRALSCGITVGGSPYRLALSTFVLFAVGTLVTGCTVISVNGDVAISASNVSVELDGSANRVTQNETQERAGSADKEEWYPPVLPGE